MVEMYNIKINIMKGKRLICALAVCSSFRLQYCLSLRNEGQKSLALVQRNPRLTTAARISTGTQPWQQLCGGEVAPRLGGKKSGLCFPKASSTPECIRSTYTQTETCSWRPRAPEHTHTTHAERHCWVIIPATEQITCFAAKTLI